MDDTRISAPQSTDRDGPFVAVPRPSLVALVGPSGSGKSTFARRNFLSSEIVSSDAMRAAIADDEADQSVSAAAFELVHHLVRARLDASRVVVVDATNATAAARAPLLAIARERSTPAIAIVFDVGLDECLRRDAERPGRSVGADVIRAQSEELARSRDLLAAEPWTAVYLLCSVGEVAAARVVRVP